MRPRVATVLVVMAMVATACGARLTDEQRAAGIGIRAGAVTDPGPGAPGDPSVPDPSGSVIPTTGPTGGGATAAPTSGGGPTGPGAPVCTSSGTASEIGVTANQVTIAVASDVSGAQPGLFRSTWQAIGALAAYANSQGGVCGRSVKPLYLDTQANSNANRAAVLDACQKAFALVGSMSAFDDGGATVGADPDQCKGGPIPDISAITVNGKRTQAANVYPAYPVRPDYFMIGTANFIKERYPQVIKKAARLYLNAGVAKSNSAQRMNAYKTVGFEYIYEEAINIPASGLNATVNAMKKKGVEYVTYVGDYQTLVQLQTEMKNQRWYPTVRDWDSVAYSSQYIATDPEAVEGSLIFLNNALLEERATNPEMQLYESWLARTAPGVKADYFGLYAWSAGRLFLKAATMAGGAPTRPKLFEALRSIRSWDANGLHAAHDTGNKMPTGCFLYVQVKGGRFQRFAPPSKWRCDTLIKASA